MERFTLIVSKDVEPWRAIQDWVNDTLSTGVFGFRLELNANVSENQTHTVTVYGNDHWTDDLAFAIDELPATRNFISAVLIRWDYWERFVQSNDCSWCLQSLSNGADHSTCTLRLFSCQNCRQNFTCASARRFHQCSPEPITESAIEGLFRTYQLRMPPALSTDYTHVLSGSLGRLTFLVRTLLEREGALKVYVAIQLQLQKLVQADERRKLWFTSSSSEINTTTNIREVLESRHFTNITEKVDSFVGHGSGWIVICVESISLMVTIHRLQIGGTYLPLPKTLYETRYRCLINIENDDDRCFLWSILAHDHHTETRNPTRKSYYQRFVHEVDCTGVEFPMEITQIHKFERLNGIAVNVLGYKDKGGLFTEYHSKFVDEFDKVINLLYLRDLDSNFKRIGHFVLITNLPRLLSTSADHNKRFACLRCHKLFTTDQALTNHQEFCSKFGLQVVKFPKENVIEFKNFKKTVRLPVWVVFDLECALQPQSASIGSKTTTTAKHVPCSYALKVCSDEYNQWDLPVEYHSGNDVIENLVSRLYEIYEDLKPIIHADDPMTPLTAHEERYHETRPNCHICEKPFIHPQIRVHDHQHHPLREGQTSNYIGPAHVW